MKHTSLRAASVCAAAALALTCTLVPAAQAGASLLDLGEFVEAVFSPLIDSGSGDSAQDGASEAVTGADRAFELLSDLITAHETESGDISSLEISVDDLVEAIDRLYTDPALDIYNGCSYSYRSDRFDANNTTVTSVELKYSLSAQELAGYDQVMDTALEQVVAAAREAEGDAGVVRAVHDYLVRTCAFDSSGASASSTAYGALVYGKATNSGYADAFCLALERLGISTRKIHTETGSVWAMAQVDGAWYHVDVCWDDPTPDRGADGQVSYLYFLVSDEVIAQDHDSWSVDVEAPLSYTETVLGSTAEERQAFANELVRSAAYAFETEVPDIAQYGLTVTEVETAVETVEAEAAYSHLKGQQTGYSHRADEDEQNGLVTSLTLTYNYVPDDVEQYWSAFENGMAQALSTLNDAMSDYEKVLALHDYLVRTCAYDESSASAAAHSAYGALVEGTAVCDGYAYAYQALLERIGISCVIVRSDAMDHAWNMVCLDGTWYYVDVTWDDPTPDRGYYAEVSHDHFLRGEGTWYSLGYYGFEAPYETPGDYWGW